MLAKHHMRPACRGLNTFALDVLQQKLCGRPPSLLRPKPQPKRLKDEGSPSHELGMAKEPPVNTPRSLVEASSRSGVSLDLLKQAAELNSTFSECSLVLKALAECQTSLEPSVRYLAEKMVQIYETESQASNLTRHLCLASSSLARTRVWVAPFGALVEKALHGEGELNCTDIVMVCRFLAVFARFTGDMRLASAWSSAHARLKGHEQKGMRMEALGLVSLLRSMVISEQATSHGLSIEGSELAQWLRFRLLDELPLCSPRQLASTLLDLKALNLLDEKCIMNLQREVTRSLNTGAMRARDLACIIAGYSKRPGTLQERQNMIGPLLPNMVDLMDACSVHDMCELLHGLASAHIAHRALLEVWSSNFVQKAEAARLGSVSPIQLSVAIADLAKLRFVQKDPHSVFPLLLQAVSDVSPSLGGLSVCHVVCALARVHSVKANQSLQVLTTDEELFDRSLLQRLELQLLRRAGELQPQGLSASAAAFVKLRHFSQELFDGLVTAALPRLDSFSPEDFAMMSSALSFVQRTFGDLEFLPRLAKEAANSLKNRSWTPRQVTQVLYPFRGGAPHDLLQAATCHLRAQSSNYSPRDIAKLLAGLRPVMGDKAVASDLWDASKPRLRRSSETLAIAQSLVALRRAIPVSQLRYRFRLLSRSLQRSLERHERPFPLEEVSTAMRVWALLGLRDWPLLAKLASNALETLSGASLLPGTSSLHPADVSQAFYALAKLGAPGLVPERFRPPISEFWLRSARFLLTDVASLSDRSLQQVLLGVALAGETGDDQRELLQQGLNIWLSRDTWRTAMGTARLVANCAALEFAIAEVDSQDAFNELLAQRSKESRAWSAQDLISFQRNVHKALEKFLSVWAEKRPGSIAHISIMHPTPACDVPLAIPSHRVAVVVGLPEDFFGGPREAWAETDVGWGLAESEVDHAPMPGDFIGMLEADGMHSAVEWQRLPALKTRLLKRLGWTVVEVPYFEWRNLLRAEEPKFLGRLLDSALDEEGRSARSESRSKRKGVLPW